MRRLAPRARNSWARRSPTSSETLKAAVTTAIPRASAAPVRSLRRGRRPKESATRRRNINVGEHARLARNLLSGTPETGEIHHDVAAIDAGCDTDGIAAALVSDTRNVDGRAAMAADDVLAVLPIAFGATDAARIESCAVAIGFLDDHEAQGLIGNIHGE